jgi:hypothetical protein
MLHPNTPPPPHHQGIPYFDTVLELGWSNDPYRYTGRSVATVRASHARQVIGYDPDEKAYPGPPS